MRLRGGDPGADKVIVLWHGMPLWYCLQVDTDEGWADHIVTDDAGRILQNGDGVVTERLYGAITLEPRA